MATLSGVIRSYNASVRRMEREKIRRNREATRQYKAYQKQQALENAQEEVRNYEQYIEIITSIHKECSESISWEEYKKVSPPLKPLHERILEITAKEKLNKYKPTFFDKIFKQVEKKRNKLNINVQDSINLDHKEYEEKLSVYNNDYKGWLQFIELCEGVINRNPEFYLKAIETYSPYEDIKELGSSINFNIKREYLIADIEVNSEEVIPKENKTLTSTGKLSIKKNPESKINEMYQDYVCGCILRIARETFSLLPVKFVFVNAIGNLLNTKTGHLEKQTILSVAIPQSTITTLNFETLDCSDSMKNFIHYMNFTRANGFSRVDKIDINTINFL